MCKDLINNSKCPYNEKNITRQLKFAALTCEILFLPLEHKIHIFSQPCNILYICPKIVVSFMNRIDMVGE